MFIGRRKELNLIQKYIDSSQSELGIIYGIRQIGKTTLLKEIIKKNKGIYYIADQTGIEFNLKQLSQQVTNYFRDFNYDFRDYYELFQYLSKKSQKNKKKIILVIDEFSYLIQSDPTIISILQKAWDEYIHKNNKIKIILSGSHSGIMSTLDGYKHPLYQRTTFKKQILPFGYEEAALFYSNLNPIDKIQFYSIFGGIPFILKQIKPQQSLNDNIKNIFLSQRNNMEEMIIALLGHENKKTIHYEPILKALSNGKSHQLKDIVQLSNKNKETIIPLIDVLINMKLITKEISFGSNPKKSKKTNYSFRDSFLKFYYYFIKNNESESIIMNKTTFFKEFVQNKLKQFISFQFEKICQMFLKRKYQKEIKNIGRYWDNKGINDLEIDIVLSIVDNQIFFFECKWHDQKIDEKIIEAFEEKVQKVVKLLNYNDKKIQLGFFSKIGFNIKNIHKQRNYLLFTPSNLYDLF